MMKIMNILVYWMFMQVVTQVVHFGMISILNCLYLQVMQIFFDKLLVSTKHIGERTSLDFINLLLLLVLIVVLNKNQYFLIVVVVVATAFLFSENVILFFYSFLIMFQYIRDKRERERKITSSFFLLQSSTISNNDSFISPALFVR